jgi:hypothetical protein
MDKVNLDLVGQYYPAMGNKININRYISEAFKQEKTRTRRVFWMVPDYGGA